MSGGPGGARRRIQTPDAPRPHARGRRVPRRRAGPRHRHPGRRDRHGQEPRLHPGGRRQRPHGSPGSTAASSSGSAARTATPCRRRAPTPRSARTSPSSVPPKALVLDAIENGRASGNGQMAADLVEGEDAEAVAEFVAVVGGQDPRTEPRAVGAGRRSERRCPRPGIGAARSSSHFPGTGAGGAASAGSCRRTGRYDAAPHPLNPRWTRGAGDPDVVRGESRSRSAALRCEPVS